MMTKVILHSNLCNKYLCKLQLAKHNLATTNTPTDAPQLSYTPVTFPVSKLCSGINIIFSLSFMRLLYARAFVLSCSLSYIISSVHQKIKIQIASPLKVTVLAPGGFFLFGLCVDGAGVDK